MTLTLESPYSLSLTEAREYQENGYARIRGALTPTLVEQYRRAISRQVARMNTEARPLAERTVYEQAFLQTFNLWTVDDTARELVFSQRLARIAAELMGCEGVRIYHDQALFKEAHGGITPWHADQYYWPVDSDRTITAWIPLQETPLEMGPLAFAPGSHRLKFGRDLEIGAESEARLAECLREYPVDERAFECGEVSFHSGWTFHRAGANATSRVREVMTIIYVDRDIRLAEPRNANQERDRERWCPGVRIGETLASRLNPTVYEAR